MVKNCLICSKEFSVYGGRKLSAKFCSMRCKGKSMLGSNGYWTGKKRTYENPKARALKISKTMKGKRPVHLDYQKGENHPSWKDGRSKTKLYKSYWGKILKARRKNAIGKYSFEEWENLKAQYNWICPRCEKREPEIKLTVDHIIPISKGGSNNIENIQPLCGRCNSIKNNKTIKYEIK